MKHFLFFVLLSITTYSQKIKIQDDFVFVNKNKVAKLEFSIESKGYKLYDLSGNLLLNAQPKNITSTINVYDVTDNKNENLKTLKVQNFYFNKSKELIGTLYYYNFLDENGVYIDKLFSASLSDLASPLEKVGLRYYDFLKNNNYTIKNKEVYANSTKVGYFKTKRREIQLPYDKIIYEKTTLYDIDHNFIVAHNKIIDRISSGKVINEDVQNLYNILYFDYLFSRGKSMLKIEGNTSEEILHKKMLEYAIENKYALGNQVNELSITKSDYTISTIYPVFKYDFTDGIFLGLYNNEIGYCSFKKVKGFNEEFGEIKKGTIFLDQ